MKKKSHTIRNVLILSGLVILGGVLIFNFKKSPDKVTASKNVEKSHQVSIHKEAPKHKDTDIVPGYNITYAAEKYSVPANEVEQMLEAKYKGNTKMVFLTFDDGPSINTKHILNILNEKGVRATFFVIGSNLKSQEDKDLLKEEIKDGNAIANHTYSHNYKKLYPGNATDINYFVDEVNNTNKIMKEILGNDFNTRVLRMPGGYMSRKYYRDPNLNQLNAFLGKENIVNLDWDAETGDATGKPFTVEQMVQNAGKYIKTENHVILLMHDAGAKVQTVRALPSIIDFFKANGYEFKVIKNSPIKDKQKDV